ncbi:hypothetical protein HanIR_Chr13g0656171 [Helianthus annuus]|nr:hypothetical protein HanIR_Chr13g0656171 [Helianthus annuus]
MKLDEGLSVFGHNHLHLFDVHVMITGNNTCVRFSIRHKSSKPVRFLLILTEDSVFHGFGFLDLRLPVSPIFIFLAELRNIYEKLVTPHPNVRHPLFKLPFILNSFKTRKTETKAPFVSFPCYINSFNFPEVP